METWKNRKLFFVSELSQKIIKVIKNETELNKKLNTLGPDIMDNSTTYEIFKQRIQDHSHDEKH